MVSITDYPFTERILLLVSVVASVVVSRAEVSIHKDLFKDYEHQKTGTWLWNVFQYLLLLMIFSTAIIVFLFWVLSKLG
jgi:hypothetical protein